MQRKPRLARAYRSSLAQEQTRPARVSLKASGRDADTTVIVYESRVNVEGNEPVSTLDENEVGVQDEELRERIIQNEEYFKQLSLMFYRKKDQQTDDKSSHCRGSSTVDADLNLLPQNNCNSMTTMTPRAAIKVHLSKLKSVDLRPSLKPSAPTHRNSSEIAKKSRRLNRGDLMRRIQTEADDEQDQDSSARLLTPHYEVQDELRSYIAPLSKIQNRSQAVKSPRGNMPLFLTKARQSNHLERPRELQPATSYSKPYAKTLKTKASPQADAESFQSPLTPQAHNSTPLAKTSKLTPNSFRLKLGSSVLLSDRMDIALQPSRVLQNVKLTQDYNPKDNMHQPTSSLLYTTNSVRDTRAEN